MTPIDTIVAVSTAPGRGAIGILRLSGPRAAEIAQGIAGPVPAPRRAALRHFRDEQGETLDQGLVLYFPAPHSYTGEDLVELQGHGGPVVLDLLLRAACARGARIARAGEFSQRAFLNDRLDLAQAEAVADLIDAASRDAVRAANRSLEGEFSRQVNALVEELISLRVFVEGALDFSDEDVDWLADAGIGARVAALQQRIDTLLAQAAQGRRLREGMVIAVAGQPNVGKSTLLNRLAGADAAIVSDIAGTTRDLLREHLVLDGLPLTIVDTAGLRDSTDPIEREGIRRAWGAVEAAELVLFVVDDRVGLTAADLELLERLPPSLPRLLIRNKSDLSANPPANPATNELRLSAATGAGIEQLCAAIKTAAGLQSQGEGVFSARRRHVESLQRASAHTAAALASLQHRAAAELAAEELRLAQDALSEITGAFTSDDLLGAIFSRFCIGK